MAVSFTTDALTSRPTELYLKKTCHFVNKDWKLCSRILQTGQFLGSHKGERVGFELKDCMLNWGILVKFNLTRIALRVMSRSSVLGDNSYGDTRS